MFLAAEIDFINPCPASGPTFMDLLTSLVVFAQEARQILFSFKFNQVYSSYCRYLLGFFLVMSAQPCQKLQIIDVGGSQRGTKENARDQNSWIHECRTRRQEQHISYKDLTPKHNISSLPFQSRSEIWILAVYRQTHFKTKFEFILGIFTMFYKSGNYRSHPSSPQSLFKLFTVHKL